MALSKEQMIAIAKENNEKRKKQEADRKSGNYKTREYDEVEWVGLEDLKPALVRFTGSDINCRQFPTDSKTVYISWIIGDDGKKYKIIFPAKEDQPNWFLWKVFNKVASYKWNAKKVKSDGTLGDKDYLYAKNHPELLNRVLKNGVETPDKYEKGWYPPKTLIWNVVDYMDDWCVTNKHTKLLSKKINDNGETRFVTEGVPYEIYKQVFSKMVENFGFFDEYQTIVIKDATDKKYTLYHPIEEGNLKVVKDFQASELGKKIKNTFEDEADYILYDIDKLFQVSSYQKINKVLGLFIQEVDKKLNTKFHDELTKLVEEEKVRFAEIYGKKEEEQLVETPVNPWTNEPVKEQPKVETKPEVVETKPEPTRPIERPVRTPKVESKPEVFSPSKYSDKFPHLKDLNEEELSHIIGFDENVTHPNGVSFDFIYDEKSGEMYTCTTCGKYCPGALTHCPTCGTNY